MKTYFISGINTDSGKSVITGLIGRYLLQSGGKTITAKLAQTGCEGISEDILTHRRLMGCSALPEDCDGLTCPYVFKFPASPHLAAELENHEIEPERITRAITSLQARYDNVLIEGAGGLLAPLTRNLLTADYVKEQGWKLIIVSSGKLGSINHTLLTIDAAIAHGLKIAGVVYNGWPKADTTISADSENFIKEYLRRRGCRDCMVNVPLLTDFKHLPQLDFADILC